MQVRLILSVIALIVDVQTEKTTEALNTGNSNEWYTEPGVWLFVFIFIFVMTLVIVRKYQKKKE
ncbi:hypothetical protein ACR78Z_06380 [Sphingobacterium thalpophilum]|uniref:Uncharacterized protein n=1 Tax=Sphingobacterium thalpophilum TaxID=259 RepID=A0A4U9VT14_9SPHI|nr:MULTISPECIES: hypothetical protein [Sphingobacterium]MCW8313274.1 hypothetical protein [Sphingobacterium sp. InxBP1]VTR50635.1 Uncharacterised protein [Sphingobacterium thalpophilum]